MELHFIKFDTVVIIIYAFRYLTGDFTYLGI